MAVIIQINTGHEIKTLDDTYLDIANEVGKTLTGGGPPGATGVDILPLRACQAVEKYLYADAAHSPLPTQLVRSNWLYCFRAQAAPLGKGDVHGAV